MLKLDEKRLDNLVNKIKYQKEIIRQLEQDKTRLIYYLIRETDLDAEDIPYILNNPYYDTMWQGVEE